MKKTLAIFLFLLIAFCGSAQALEIVRQKNIATRIVFPIVDADGDAVTGAAGLDSEIDEFADGSNPTGFADCTNEATEIGTTGIYYLNLTSTEMNQDYLAVQVKTTTSGGKTQHILVRTIAGDPKSAATVTTAGNSIDVASTGEVGLDFSNIKNATGSTTLTNITIPTVTDVTNAVGVKTGTGANQLDVTSGRIKADAVYWNGSAVATPDTTGYPKVTIKSGTGTGEVSLSSGAVTVGTNSDKTGYSLTQSFPTNFSSLSIDGSGRVDLGKWIGVAPNALISGRVDTNAQIVGDKTGYTASTVTDKTGYSLSAAGMALFFTTDTTETYADAVAGSVVKEIADNAGGSALTVQDIVDGVWDELIAGHLTSATMGAALNAAGSAGDPWSTPLPGAYGSGTAGYIIGNNINATISSRSSHSAADVWAVSTRLLTAGTNISLAKGTGITGFNDLSAAQVNTEVDTALNDIKLDKLLNASATLSSDVALGSVVGQLLDNGTSWSFDRTTDSLEALRDRGDLAWTTSALSASDVWAYSTRVLTANTNLNDPSAAVIADTVWDEVRSGHTTAGSFGQGVASVQGNVTGSVNSVTAGVTVTTNNDKTGYSLSQSFPTNFSTLSIDANGRVDLSKWLGSAPNAIISGRVDSNAQVVGDKTGYSLTQGFPSNFSALAITAGGAVTVGTNNDKTGYALTSAEEDAIVDKVWDESQSGHTGAGTFGKYLDAQVSLATAPSAATVASAVWEEISNHTTAGTMGKKLNDAALSGNPWEAASICGGLTAGQCLSGIKDSTDGDKEGSDYTGIEKTIRSQR